jgi:RNA 3'-terminal phosphate cyclase (ATP)
MVILDGSYGEGGGQILRTATALSVLLGIPCKIENIRKKRPNPGLRPQHVAGIKALLKLTQGEAEGVREGSESLVLFPGKLRGGSFEIDVGTAGSIGLVLQSIMIVATGVPSRLRLKIRGGTDVKWAPSILYLKEVLLNLLKRMGYQGEIELLRRGYYPRGGGEVLFEARVSELKGINLEKRGEILTIRGVSHASKDLEPKRVAERQREAALSLLRSQGLEAHIKIRYEDTPSTGSGIDLFAICSNSVLGANALGEKGKRAEEVGKEAASGLLEELQGGSALDQHASDQILPYLALAKGPSVVSVSRLTGHLETNLWVIRNFIKREIRLEKTPHGYVVIVEDKTP